MEASKSNKIKYMKEALNWFKDLRDLSELWAQATP